MKWLSNFSLKKLFSNKKFAVSFSVIVAFIFWLVIVIDQNPERQISFNVPVSLSAVGTNLEPLNMEIVSHNIGDNVSVSVKGPSYVVSSLKNDDFMVTADFSGIEKTGEYVLNLVAQRISGKTGYEIVSINPSTVTLTIDKIVDEFMEVEVLAPNVTLDVDADSGLGIEPMKVEEKIHIKGPQSEFKKIAKVKAVVDEKAVINASKNFDAAIKLYDIYDNEIDPTPFTLSASNIQVTAKVYKKVSLPLKPVFINKSSNAPDLKYEFKLSSGEAISEIVVQGDPDIIANLTTVELEPIDFSKIAIDNTQFEVKLNLFTESIKSSENIESVLVSFDLSAYNQKGLAVDVEVLNAPDGLTIDRQSLKSVLFTVPKTDVKKFDADSVVAVADLKDKNVGDSVVVTFTSKIANVWANGSYTVTVKAK